MVLLLVLVVMKSRSGRGFQPPQQEKQGSQLLQSPINPKPHHSSPIRRIRVLASVLVKNVSQGGCWLLWKKLMPAKISFKAKVVVKNQRNSFKSDVKNVWMLLDVDFLLKTFLFQPQLLERQLLEMALLLLSFHSHLCFHENFRVVAQHCAKYGGYWYHFIYVCLLLRLLLVWKM